jgi:hypothetical protein
MLLRLTLLLSLCATVFFLLPHRPVQGAVENPAVENHLVGDAACVRCHAQVSGTYAHTSHHLTSQLPSRATILGSFQPPANVLVISAPSGPASSEEPRLSFKMEARTDGFYQTAQADLGEQHLTRSERFDVVVGNGTRGQTYLYWKQDGLFELPVSFWSTGSQWINSPGYRDGTANFARHVDARCLECHATYAKALSADPQSNTFDRASLRLGISCESCHGPGAEHVAVQSAGPVPGDRTILNPARFPRDRQIDQCALCHNGTARQELAQAFSYVPGQELSRYLAPNGADQADSPDVHGNQVGLLKRSACFRGSPAMTCSTCHNTHAAEPTAAAASATCMQCHRIQSCPEAVHQGKASAERCVACHMPMIETNAIVSETAGRTIRTSIRTHWIKVYPAALEQGVKEPGQTAPSPPSLGPSRP